MRSRAPRLQVTLVWGVGDSETVGCERAYREGDELVLGSGPRGRRVQRRLLVRGLVEYVVVEVKR